MDNAKPALLKRRRTKIVATLGPASADLATVRQLISAGVNVFRLNMSHGEHADHRKAYEGVRAAAAELGQPVAVLADLCGPKIRAGRFDGGRIDLQEGSEVTVTTRDVLGRPGLIPSQYELLADDVRPGDSILLDDGLIALKVLRVEGTEIACQVVHGGVLKDRKGMNLPGVSVSAVSFTEKDREDACFSLELGVEFVALSFVRRAADLRELKSLIAAEAGSRSPGDSAGAGATHLIAKIETPEGLEAVDEILEECDGIMVARGDLGVEMPPDEVPVAQRQLIARARATCKPVIVATQMLESMVGSPRPTRAEVSDVSTAVFGGADAVMLSAETAAGRYPVGAVEMMDRIARRMEAQMFAEGAFEALARQDETPPPVPLHIAVARSTAQLARDLRARAILVLSRTGTTARMVAAARPAAPVLAASTDARVCARMHLLWGVVPALVEEAEYRQPRELARRLARDLDLAGAGQHILVVAGFRSDPADSAPGVTIVTV